MSIRKKNTKKKVPRQVPDNMPLAYLACPYSHELRSVRCERFEKANRAAAKLMESGVVLFSPISHTHPIADANGLPLNWEYWERYDRAFLSVTSKMYVLMIDGWRESKGVQAEIRIAEELGIAIEYLPESFVA